MNIDCQSHFRRPERRPSGYPNLQRHRFLGGAGN